MSANLGMPSSLKSNHDDAYQAALKAADEVFGGKISTGPVEATISSPNHSVGRVLPSLTGEDDARLSETREKDRSFRKVQKAQRPPSSRRKEQVLPVIEDVKVPDEQSAECLSFQKPASSALRRKRRPIQKRWVLKTELKAGQKWKRRFYRSIP